MSDALNRLTKWRTIFTGWQLGTRPKGDPESDAVRDHRELTILLRAEVNTLVVLLVAKGVFTAEEYQKALDAEAEALSKLYERRFPGFKARDYGMEVNAAIAKDTMSGWLP